MKKVGEVLSEFRQKQNVPLEKVSQVTRIRKEFLEAIERNEFEKLPAEPFVKGFLHSYAQFLGMDPETVLALLRRDFKTGEKGKVVPRQFIKTLDRKKSWIGPHLTAVVSVSVVVFLILGFAALQFWRFLQPPELEVFSPDQDELVGKNVTVRGKTTQDAVVTVDEKPVALSTDGEFETAVFYTDNGTYTITIRAEDRHKHASIIHRTVKVEE
jgi:cytoskeletal protein RodZ